MHLFINASAASAGGGLTYLRNVIPHLSTQPDLKTTVLAARGFFGDLGKLPRVSFLAAEQLGRTASSRFWREQTLLPSLIRRCGGDVLISAGNMALFRSPVPQILLTRNALYTSSDFYADTWRRGDLRLWLSTRIRGLFAKWSVLRSDWVVTPSEAFANEIRDWVKNRSRSISTIPHGFDSDRFFSEAGSLPLCTQRRLSEGTNCLRLLFVSHFNYFRNFDTLIRALPMLKSRYPGKSVKLVLTCRLKPALAWGPYDATRAERLVRELGIADDIIELDLVPYPLLYNVYRACDIYVTPSYAESFAHPLVEAMACGLPIVASDLPVHREVCGDAAVYYPRFSPEALTDRVAEIARSPEITRDMAARGLARSLSFSWKEHVIQLISLAAQLVDNCKFTSSSVNTPARSPIRWRSC